MPILPRITTVKGSSHGAFHGVYEIVESEDGLYVTIRDAHNRERQVRLERSAIPALVGALRKIHPKGESI